MTLTIGQVAEAAAVNIQTLRYYERRGLVGAPGRTKAGYRQYSTDTVGLIRFIRRAQALGFTLEEVRELLDLRVRHGDACDDVERRTRNKIDSVERKILDLQRMRRALEHLAEACAVRRSFEDCPLLRSLEAHEIDDK